MDIDREKALTIAGIVAVLAGILVVPPLVQKFYGFSAVKTAFVVIVLYAVINYAMQQRR
ncbi:hypothetical protein [Candidatus Nanohalovita haloferacivicina]|uniref:hypothetical protein n=1 Tax=Candidatus Nanohalovita haloferacivicina TaxID=2978046 RepID=UPI00325FDDFC|nr:hypothetical protein HBNXNv_0593 [Candidatus Nanohalobia archaeon BNXNv]